ncbi:MAG: APC family permease [Terriglobales bacterium]
MDPQPAAARPAPSPGAPPVAPNEPTSALVRGMGLPQATAANMLNMIGIGPFITLGTILGYMGGPQAMLGWLLGAVLSMCDGLVYAELGAALPGAGGAFVYFREAFNPASWGLLFSFLFLWEMLFSGPLGMAAACVGFGDYAQYLAPRMGHVGVTLLAMGVAAVITLLLYRPIASVGKLSMWLLAVVLAAIGWVIVAGVLHMSVHQAFAFPPGAFRFDGSFFVGLSSATLFALYNYGGYNNVTYLGGEVREPGKNIPRAIVVSILVVAALYLMMSICVVGVVPWHQAVSSNAVISDFIGRIYGRGAADVMTGLILVATFGGVFALSLGYSRILFAAGEAGQFFRVFGRVHRTGRFPTVSLLAINGAALVLCWLPVEQLIQAQMIVQIVFQFIPQVLAVYAIRRYRKQIARPFRMWLYPLPALLALLGWIYVASSPGQLRYLGVTAVLAVAGIAAYGLWAWRRRQWPLAARRDPTARAQ